MALLSRNNPFGLIASALLFGALHKGSLDLDLESEMVTRDFSQIIQALIILCVSADAIWGIAGEKLKEKFPRFRQTSKAGSLK